MQTQAVKQSSVKLNDQQLRQFICDGVVVLESGVPASVNEQIFAGIQWNNTREFNMGNNVLPRIPQLQKVLDAPVIHGALQSVLGEDYILHPHRFMHASEPLDEDERNLNLSGSEHGPTMGKGSSGSSHWHQDSQSPLSRARYHVPRLAMILYFPQDTPVERGPTRVIPGTHLHARLHESDYPFALVSDHIQAGTCLLIAFDIGHAGLSNLTNLSRYMFKFVFMRCSNPVTPSWDGGSDTWQPPGQRLGQFSHDRTCAYIWDWMRGALHTSRASRVEDVDPMQIDTLISQLNHDDQALRLNAIYALAGIGADAVDPVATSLLTSAGKQREFNLRYRKDDQNQYIPEGDPHERRWSEGAYVVQDEAYTLGAIGTPAISTLIKLLRHDDAWIKINAAFALGETGSAAAPAVSALADQLSHQRHQVVRAVLDAISCIGCNTSVAFAAIKQLLSSTNPAWQKPIMRGWSGENQVRFNAMCALLCSDIPAQDMEDLLIDCLDDENGYVPALALEMLTRDGSRRGMQSALSFLKTHRWDDTLAHGQRVF